MIRTNGILKDKHVMIVGGSSGIGLATAKQAKAEGAIVTIVGFNPDQTERIAKENEFEWRAADITKQETIKVALSDVRQVDHLVLLAGTFVAGTVLEADIDYLHKAFDERIWGALYIIRSLDEMLSQDASITFTSGVLADRPGPGTAILAAASSAVESLARGLALELAPRRVNTVSPGTTDSPLLSKSLGSGREAFINSMKEKLPLKRVATTDQVALAILFFMTNEIMTGETVHVDGGQRLI
ncbi:NAD(P)-dependent dehydrogenase, short-chain alcohol dehydrogenase family [Chryseobacterium oranimense]|uniref:NAD(P)-dependent dehydrogenase, short-chain alcohol dehydrogenase family n=1 Tax=Chryseobacterium oranimense TaxID=421058 RepID=A0A1M5UDQ3_9FLAO|nr:SDR family oxidoreductase [Chryseobacterium oranimense]SHH61182.1 NAD(P)-dependent dehydrogenase, short-chain alcohol dehydrogenase family [Chryseobacterium oranimense]